ncbi:hypothetical protein DCCM_3242 [Desulfocucumis palustris]|uniref:Transcriptional regulator n=1 Tax=Desulfocucumis palustris TaxID=1898651 RepID=A0A2L2XD91_9FIRM|nr:hypothetical protein [Desulfocucumis palustris]GBF34130.1 hypothetical protein DCCM_3242 [Desulfocucumis palustris]
MIISQSKELRGFVLNMCKVNYPHGCSEQLIQTTAEQNQFDVSTGLIAGHIEYLEEKGYVRVDEIKNNRLKIVRKMVYITAKGIDLLEGNIPEDPGVLTIPEE